jgi:hypothetical protein
VIEEAVRALPGGVMGPLPVVYVVASAVTEAVPLSDTQPEWITSVFARFLKRSPTTAERQAVLECLREAKGTREVRIALASAAWSDDVAGRTGGRSPPSVMIACPSGIDLIDLFADPDRFPAVRGLARTGALAAKLERGTGDPRADMTAALYGHGAGASFPTIFEFAAQAGGAEAWLVTPRAVGWEHLARPSTAMEDDEVAGVRFWPADGASHPAFRSLVEQFGRPRPLGSGGWDRVRSLREAMEAPVPSLEIDVSRALGKAPAAADASRIGAFVEALLRVRRPRLTVAVLMDTEVQPGESTRYKQALGAIDNLVGSLAPVTEAGGSLFLFSLSGRLKSEKDAPGPGFALAAGKRFRPGRVVAAPHKLRAVGATLAKALGLPAPSDATGITAMLRRRK